MDISDHDDAARSAARHEQDRVLDTSALRALAHPLRVRMYDILSQYGPQTSSSLAVRLGESSGSMSYHLRALAKHDLIREIPDRGTVRERWWERPPGGVTLGPVEAAGTPAGRAAVQLVTHEVMRNRNQQLADFLTSGIDDEDETWRDAALVSTATTRMTPAQTALLRGRIMALIDDAVDTYRDQTGDDVRPVTIRADIFPLPDLGGDV
ncbi:helix-turn-helix domain-containing protein [Microbacterium sp. NPDC077184]|uniref:winged helix-turn-helix domain-containing protein n=1 Tax=Microbacterium sp. NPDC077184 TaxID=3154764 RepID=UPI003431C370